MLRQLLTTCAVFLAILAPMRAAADGPSSEDAAADQSIKALGFEVLSGDRSRQELFENVRLASIAEDGPLTDQQVSFFNLYGPFHFPDDVDFDVVLQKPRTAVFGVDISHYTLRSFPIESLHAKRVKFVYMKATQGARYVDDHFADFWKRAGKLPAGAQVHRGAYHFLSAGDPNTPARAWGVAQAKAFVKVLRANAPLLKTDMPPVVDLEWDVSSSERDHWVHRSPQEILEVVLGFLEQTKADLGVAPMVYTARSWWDERIKSEALVAKLAGYPLWGADYSRASRASENPKAIHSQKWALWQFTAAANMKIGFNPGFDANVFEGDENAFYSAFPIEKFQ